MLDRFAVHLTRFLRFVRGEKGQDLVEYGILMALIAVVCIISVIFLGQQLSTVWSQVSSTLASAL